MQLLVCILSSPRELLVAAASDFVLPFRDVSVQFVEMADASEISNRRAPGRDAMAVASLTEVKIPVWSEMELYA